MSSRSVGLFPYGKVSTTGDKEIILEFLLHVRQHQSAGITGGDHLVMNGMQFIASD